MSIRIISQVGLFSLETCESFYWNPKLQLIFVFTSPTDYYVCRPKFKKKLLSDCSNVDINHFSWGSFGRVYTFCDKENRVTICDIERDGEVIHTFDCDETIVNLFWSTGYIEDDPIYITKMRPKLLLPIYTLPPEISMFKPIEIKGFRKDKRSILLKSKFNSLSFIVLVSKRRIMFKYYGIYPFFSITFKKYFEEDALYSVSSVGISNDLNIMGVVYYSRRKRSVSEGQKFILRLGLLDLEKFAENKKQLHFVLSRYCDLDNLFVKIKGIVRQLQNVWKEYYQTQVLDVFVKPVENFEPGKSLKDVFYQFFFYGKIPDAMVSLFVDSQNPLTERLLGDNLATLQVNRCNTANLFSEFLLNYIKHVIYILSEIHGCALWEERFGDLGLRKDDIQKLLDSYKDLYKDINQNIILKYRLFCVHLFNFINYLRQIFHLHFSEPGEDEGNYEKAPLPPSVLKDSVVYFLDHYDNIPFNYDDLLKKVQDVEDEYRKKLPENLTKSISKTIKKVRILGLFKLNETQYQQQNLLYNLTRRSINAFLYFGVILIRKKVIVILRVDSFEISKIDVLILRINQSDTKLSIVRFNYDQTLSIVFNDNNLGIIRFLKYRFEEYNYESINIMIKNYPIVDIVKFDNIVKFNQTKIDKMETGNVGIGNVYSKIDNSISVFKLNEEEEEDTIMS